MLLIHISEQAGTLPWVHRSCTNNAATSLIWLFKFRFVKNPFSAILATLMCSIAICGQWPLILDHTDLAHLQNSIGLIIELGRIPTFRKCLLYLKEVKRLEIGITERKSYNWNGGKEELWVMWHDVTWYDWAQRAWLCKCLESCGLLDNYSSYGWCIFSAYLLNILNNDYGTMIFLSQRSVWDSHYH